jgi:hypothetical protein
MKKTLIAALCSLGLLSAAHATNVVLGSTVHLHGTFFTDPTYWSTGTNGTPDDLVNGVFQPDGTQWDFNSTWWNGDDNPNNCIVIDLSCWAKIWCFTVQADDNDDYKLEYWGTDSAWHDAWDILAPQGWGLTTSSTFLDSPIITDKLRFTAVDGDGLYAVSQIEAKGKFLCCDPCCTPSGSAPDATSTVALLGGAIGLIGWVRKFKTTR